MLTAELREKIKENLADAKVRAAKDVKIASHSSIPDRFLLGIGSGGQIEGLFTSPASFKTSKRLFLFVEDGQGGYRHLYRDAPTQKKILEVLTPELFAKAYKAPEGLSTSDSGIPVLAFLPLWGNAAGTAVLTSDPSV
ncbi:hypothetical protein [Hugenholtzia roseola]|uniref:hypothetical protein n=1 Tax=Hugenholtzia roseola TaxID=1002 RepID=UPI00047EF415|nr:hypothetical protein [Hugenholtzia roseola]